MGSQPTVFWGGSPNFWHLLYKQAGGNTLNHYDVLVPRLDYMTDSQLIGYGSQAPAELGDSHRELVFVASKRDGSVPISLVECFGFDDIDRSAVAGSANVNLSGEDVNDSSNSDSDNNNNYISVEQIPKQ